MRLQAALALAWVLASGPALSAGAGADKSAVAAPQKSSVGGGRDLRDGDDFGFLLGHSGAMMILITFTIMVITLIILVPQLLRANLRRSEMIHLENLKALEHGRAIHPGDERSRVAGRMAMLVPMVVMIAAATVTCFLIAYRESNVFTVSLAVWVVAGIVSLAAITGGVALIGRLAQLQSGKEDEDVPENPLE